MYAYIRVCERISHDIENHVYKPDQKLPTEREMCEEFDVSISTIRKSMYYLRDKGLIYSKRGSGYYVSKQHVTLSNFEGPSLSKLGINKNVKTKLVSFNIRRANLKEAKEMKIKANTIIYEIKRIRYVKDKLSQIEYTLIPVGICPDLVEEQAELSLNKVFVENGNDRVNVSNKLVKFNEQDFESFEDISFDINEVNFNLIKKLEILDGTIIEYSKILVFDNELNYEYIHLY